MSILARSISSFSHVLHKPRALPPQPRDVATLGQTVLANRISTVLNVGAIATCAVAGAAGVLCLTAGALPAVAAAALTGLGALGATVYSLTDLADRTAKDAFRGLRKLSQSIAAHMPQTAARIQPTPEEARIATSPTLSVAERENFIRQLQPGDIVLDCTANGLSFMAIVKLFGGKCDYTHAMMYEGNGQILHSTGAGGSHRSPLDDALKTATHAIAIRPAYHGQQAEDVLAHAQELLGRPYDWFANMNDDRLGCAEMVYHALVHGAPDSDMHMQSTLGHPYPAPRDFLTLEGAHVVAEVGMQKSFWNDLKTAFRVN